MMFRPYGFLAPKDFKIIRLSNILALRLFQNAGVLRLFLRLHARKRGDLVCKIK
jgi:hypothetical protein